MIRSENHITVLAAEGAELLRCDDAPAAAVPVCRAPSPAILTSLVLSNFANTGVDRHPAPIRWRPVSFLPKATHLAGTILTLRAIVWWNPDRVKPLSASAVRTGQNTPGGIRDSIPLPIICCIVRYFRELHTQLDLRLSSVQPRRWPRWVVPGAGRHPMRGISCLAGNLAPSFEKRNGRLYRAVSLALCLEFCGNFLD